MRQTTSASPANDLCPPPAPRARSRDRRRTELLSSALFAGGSIAAFLILLGCVFAATVLYYRSH